MCGIAGFTGENNPEVSDKIIRKMTHRMAHRGPDGDGHFVRPGIALGHRRLSIIDLSTAASQPMTDPTGRYTLVYNGEVYNYQAVKNELKTQSFQSNSDTDVILAAYIEWGPECVKKFNGMFAFAVWDNVKKSLFIARDRLGIKPLYYFFDGNDLIFASEIRSLLESGKVPRQISHATLSEYLRYYTVNGPNTLVRDVFMLRAGEYGLWQDGKFETHAYWHLTPEKIPHPNETYEETCARIQDLLRQAVAKRLMSDVPFGAFLSGGIDSSAIVALMAQVSDLPVNTFSVTFQEKNFDESPYSDLIARKYNTVHHPIRLRPEDFLKGLPEALSAMDHPSGDGINSYIVSKVTRETGFTVALSGLGGDELFAGYPVFRRYEKLHRMNMFYGIPTPIRSVLGKSVSTVYNNHKTARLQELISLEGTDFENIYPVFRKCFDDEEIIRLIGFHTPARKQLTQVIDPKELTRIHQLPVFSQVTVGEISTYTRNVLLRDADQMSMATSLEVRVPFFDHELVEYALGIPDAYKNPIFPKKLLVDAMGDLLPGEIVHRPKMGFVFPWDQWIRHDLRKFCEDRIRRLSQRELLDGGVIMNMWKQFLDNNKRASWMKIWMLVVLEDWMERNRIEA
ncbi:MAG: asparagine synthase (glutamine-hydrolyzing) [Bacteroidia bacterium]|nr:asparagine synthase (glutamine-hydrolyzing) [Bacteroidia bacterium]